MSIKVIIGAQWGDEGKGKLVDVLSEDVDIVIRYQGGANAGHTVYIEGKKYVLHLIPGGILRNNVRCVIGNGVVFDPVAFFDELDFLKKNGISVDNRIFISDRAHVIFSYHKLLDQLREESLRKNKIGTTGRGIGPAYVDKFNRTGIRIADLFDPSILKGKIAAKVEEVNQFLKEKKHTRFLQFDELYKNICNITDQLKPFVSDTVTYLHDAWKKGASMILEGAQGCLLDVDFGSYPYVTSSNPTSGGAITGSGLPPQALSEIIGVIKAYTTRVGEGPFPTEDKGPIGEHLRQSGGEYGATTGRPRRCGWFDGIAALYAAKLNGFSAFALTKLDVLDDMETIKVCTGYVIKGKKIEQFPASLNTLAACEPVYENLKGWQTQTSRCTKFEELPPNAQNYINFLMKFLTVPIKYVSVGMDRKQIIKL